MLKRFEVQGFKSFLHPVTIDFSDVRDYQFNNTCVKDGLLNKIIVYGRNSVGKTNLGLALFDIVSTLTSNNVTPGLYNYYLNADSTNPRTDQCRRHTWSVSQRRFQIGD